MTKEITAYKAFNTDMTCRNFKYEVGMTYEHVGNVSLCSNGFHACTVPFDCWGYYERSMTFARVSVAGVSAERDNDSKIVCAKITIEATLSLPVWIKAQVAAVVDLCKSAKGALVSKEKECAAATGYSGHAAATGDSGHAAATGDSGHAAATGYRGHAAATGDSGHAAATGDSSIAVSLGCQGTAKAGEGGAIMLAFINDDGSIGAVRACKIGENGMKPNVSYRLTKSGEFEELDT